MLTHRNVFTLWLLLHFHGAGSVAKFIFITNKYLVLPLSSTRDKTQVESTHSLDHSSGLSDELGQIFDSKIGCDFMILVQSETESDDEGGTHMVADTICAHKMILSQFPLFNASAETTDLTVSLSKSCQQHFTSFIRYLYTHKVNMTTSSVQCFHWMASKFGVKQLMNDTGRLFTKILPEDTLFHTQVSLYEYAVQTGDLGLQEACAQYLAWNYGSLTRSAAWTSLSVQLLKALLSRSDLVVPDEYFVFQSLESWITENKYLTSSETQTDLLGLIRFPMIPAEKLYELETISSLYNDHKMMYSEHMLKAFQFNVLLYSKLISNPKFNKDVADYQPRIYTAKPWSTTIDPSKTIAEPIRLQYPSYNRRNRFNHGYGSFYSPTVSPHSQTLTESFSTPVHNSLIFRDNTIQWEANVLKKQQECSNLGLRCESVPVARLAIQRRSSQSSNILFRNLLLLMCQDKYVCQVVDFKNNVAHTTVNGVHSVAYPCPENQLMYHFVVRPEYV